MPGHKGLFGISGTGLMITDGKFPIYHIMEGGTGSREGTNALTAVVRVSSAVGSVRTKAIKKGSTEVLPLDVLLI